MINQENDMAKMPADEDVPMKKGKAGKGGKCK